MHDAPFHVVRKSRLTGQGVSTLTSYAVERTGMDTICFVDDITWAYRLVDLLNEDYRRDTETRLARRLHKGGVGQRSDSPPAK